MNNNIKKLVNNTLEIECLVQSLQTYLECKQIHDKARDEYDGYSWGYYGRDYVDKMEDAAQDFGKRLELMVDSRVIAILQMIRGIDTSEVKLNER